MIAFLIDCLIVTGKVFVGCTVIILGLLLVGAISYWFNENNEKIIWWN
jgi:hypothetical protein